MWLALDIGNSAIKGAFFDGEQLLHPFRVLLHHEGAATPWEADFEACLQSRPITRAGITSVVPAVTPRVQACLRRFTEAPIQVMHHRMTLPFTLAYETPHTMGTDRLAAAAGAWMQYGREEGVRRPVIALDAGTAVTIEVVDGDGVFRGGVIGAGPQLVRHALAHGTAQLPFVPLEVPPTPVGRSTQEALQAGIMYAFVEGLRGMLRRICDVLDAPPIVVATGGWSDLLHAHLDVIDHVDPYLVLHGIRALMTLNEPED